MLLHSMNVILGYFYSAVDTDFLRALLVVLSITTILRLLRSLFRDRIDRSGMDPITPSQVLSSMLTPITPMMGETEEQDENDCPICYEPFSDAVETPCGHMFCDKCIRKALSLSDHCPLCKHRLVDSLSERWQEAQLAEHQQRFFRLIALAIGIFPLLGLFLAARSFADSKSWITIVDSTDLLAFKLSIGAVAALYIITLSEWLDQYNITTLRANTGICTLLGMAAASVVQYADDHQTMKLAEVEMVGLMFLMMSWLYHQQQDLVERIARLREDD